MSLETTYRAYLAAVNSYDWDTVLGYLHATVTVNDISLANTALIARVSGFTKSCTDLQWVADMIVYDDNQAVVAARIRLESATGAWKGPVKEHVFYQFKDGKIAHIWNVFEPRKD